MPVVGVGVTAAGAMGASDAPRDTMPSAAPTRNRIAIPYENTTAMTRWIRTILPNCKTKSSHVGMST